MFKVWCLYCLLWTYFTTCCSVSIVNIEQVNDGWEKMLGNIAVIQNKIRNIKWCTDSKFRDWYWLFLSYWLDFGSFFIKTFWKKTCRNFLWESTDLLHPVPSCKPTEKTGKTSLLRKISETWKCEGNSTRMAECQGKVRENLS